MGRSVSPLACALCVFALIASCVPSTNAFAIEIAFNETECFSKQIETARDVDGSLNLPFRVLGAYVVSKDPHKYYEMQRGERNLAIVSVEVTQPDGQVIHRDKDGKSRSEFDVDAHGVGTYSICFTNAGTKGKKAWFQALPHQKKPQEVSAFVRVHYFQPVHDDDSDAQNAEIETLRQQSPKNTKGADAAVPRKTESTTKKGSKESASKVLSTAHASDINVLALNLQDEISLMRQELFYLKARASRHKKTADSNARRTLWWTLAEVCTLCAVAGMQVSAVRYFFNKDERKGGNGGRGRARGGNAGVGTMYGGGPGGFGGGGARYQQFKDRQHVESRLKQLGALVVGRVSQKVTHVVVPGSGEALSEERRRHGCDPETGARAFLSLVEKVEKYGNGVAKFGAVNSSEPCPVGVSEAVTPSEASPPVFVKSEPVDSRFDAAVSHTKSVVSHTASAASHTAASTHTQVQVVTEGWVMRHWRAFQNGTAKTHAAEDVANHKRKLAAEKQEEKEQKKMAQKLKKEAIEFGGDDARPGRFRNLNKQALDKIAKALSQRLFFLGRKDVTRGDHPTTGQRLGTDTGTTKRTADATTLGPKQKWRALFRVFGTAGTAYECDVSEFPACSCPEFVEARRAGHGSPGAHVCGHLTWLLVRVLGVSTDDPVLCQTALTQRELAGILAPRKNMQAEGGLGTLEPDESTRACPVCRSAIVDATSAGTTSFDESLTPENSNPVEGGKKQQSDAKVLVAPCPNGCAGFVHASCTRRFAEMRNDMEGIKRAAGCETTMAATCPLCETGWVEQDSHGLAVAP